MTRAHRWDTGIQRHIGIAVDIDQTCDDRQLKKHYLPHFVRAGKATTVYDVRALCALARAKGYLVFPACDHCDSLGYCLGHSTEPPPESDTWGT